MSAAALTLREQGFRFVCRDGRGQWLHPLEVQFHDIDCTDMEDDEFAEFVAKARTSRKTAPMPARFVGYDEEGLAIFRGVAL